MTDRATKSGGLSFEEWMKRVDQWLYAEIGLESDDLPDWKYRDAYDDDTLPSVAAKRALRAGACFDLPDEDFDVTADEEGGDDDD